MTIKVAVVGAAGTMGRLASRIVEDAADLELYAQLGSTSDLDAMIGADVALDFTIPAASHAVVEFAIAHDLDVLVGTSGWSNERIATLAPLAREHPEVGVVIVPNFSIGSVLATSFAATAARFYDSIEIIERMAPRNSIRRRAPRLARPNSSAPRGQASAP